MQRTSPHKNAFTLIELLVVMGIIGILAGIILPAMHAAREKAHTANCLSNLKQIGLALQQYSNDYDGFLPHEDDKEPPNSCWYYLIDPYLETRGLDDVEINEVKLCPGVKKGKASRPESYRMNSRLTISDNPRAYTFRNVDTIRKPSATVGIFDGTTGKNPTLKFKGDDGRFSKRHQGGGNILFLDWHVKWYTRKHVKSDAKKENPTIIWRPSLN